MPELYRDLLTCVVCHKGGDSIKKCAKCFSASYCGRECQVGDWARHKRLCDPVMVKDVGEKGRGLVASKDFKVGDLIFKDTSVASINIADKFPAIYYIKYGNEVYSQISTLSEADQKNFFELSGHAEVDEILSRDAFGIFPEKYKRACSIYCNNRVQFAKEGHLYLKYSMVNHSCDPNTVGSSPDFNFKRMELRAVKEIKCGEEVTSCYLDPMIAILGERKEKELKLENWKIRCECDICLQPETDRIKELRDEWNELKLKEEILFDAMEKSNELDEFVQAFTNSLDRRITFIIKLDKPCLSFHPTSLKLYVELEDMALEANRPDLQEKGKLLLKKYLFGDIDKDKYVLHFENSLNDINM